MKHIKLIFTILTVISIYCIYKLVPSNQLTYLALGDSFALGENPYGEISYGYSDYLANYFDKNYKLKLYTKKFANTEARIKDIRQDIFLNKKIYIEERSIGLKSALREANIITLSIGANDLISQVSTISEILLERKTNEIIDGIGENLKSLIQQIKKYNKELVVIGYYNLYPNNKKYQGLFEKLDTKYHQICNQEGITYISLYKDFPIEKYLPNPFDIHPSTEGYEYIYHKILENIKY